MSFVAGTALREDEESDYNVIRRGVAQFGSALGSGPRGRQFKSARPDHSKIPVNPINGE